MDDIFNTKNEVILRIKELLRFLYADILCMCVNLKSRFAIK